MSVTQNPVIRIGARFFSLAVVCLLAAGCVASYDATTDQQITALQKKTDAFLLSLDKMPMPKPGEEGPAKTYQEIDLDINTLAVRNNARDKNENTIAQIERLRKLTFEQFKDAHVAATSQPTASASAEDRDRYLNSAGKIHAFVDTWRSTFNHAYGTLLRLELLKKDEKP
jgi:hypothetical protein